MYDFYESFTIIFERNVNIFKIPSEVTEKKNTEK